MPRPLRARRRLLAAEELLIVRCCSKAAGFEGETPLPARPMGAGDRDLVLGGPPVTGLGLSLRCAQLLLATAHLAVIRGSVASLAGQRLFLRRLFAFDNEGFVLATLRLEAARLSLRRTRCTRVVRVRRRGSALARSPRCAWLSGRESSVVRNDDITAGIVGHERFEPADRRDVEMVSRFVENQVVGLVDQYCALTLLSRAWPPEKRA